MRESDVKIDGPTSPAAGPEPDEPEGTPATRDGGMETSSRQNNQATAMVRVSNRNGLHARPAMQVVDLASKYNSQIRVCKDRYCVNAKSIMELLLLAAAEGTTLTIQAEGPDAHQAVEALTKLVESKFDEE